MAKTPPSSISGLGTSSDASERFVASLTENQNRIYGYVFSLIGDHSRAADVVQETNLVLWRKIADFDSSKPFLPWAFSIARFQVLAHLRDSSRDRVVLDAELINQLSTEAETQAAQLDTFRENLRPCIQLLEDRHRDLIESRYLQGKSISEVASQFEKTESAVKVTLLRIRRRLTECVKGRMANAGANA